MVKVTVYVTDYCGYCARAKALLDRRGIAYTEIDVTHEPEVRRWLRETTGRRTVPQIFFGDEPIGGSDELADLDASGELERRLAA